MPTTNVKKNDYAFIVTVVSGGNPEYKRYKYNGTQWLEEFVLNNSSFTANQWTSINSCITDTWINGINEKLENITSTTIIEITWSDLKAKRDAGELTLGQLYRITDYQCTTTESYTRSAGHQFDIIVLALTNNTLSEQAWAALHSGDTYFANNNLSAWKLWYCLDNDTDRFAWADNTSSNGRGVIYRMIDEFNNDIPYDFKNIQFKHPINPNSSSVYYYTFSNDTGSTDHSLSISHWCFSNTIKECLISNKKRLNHIVFVGYRCYYNFFNVGCKDNYFDSSCSNNFFSINCHDNSFGINCCDNFFGNDYVYNSSNSYCAHNSFGNSCSYNSFGSDCSYNSFGNDCSYIKFADNSSTSYKYNYYKYNHFGDGCQYILFKGAEIASENDIVQNYNFAQGLQGTSDAYLTVDGIRNRSYETKVARNSAGELKIYCEADLVQ